MRPTFAPARIRATARFAATVDLPTPPLPLATATVFFTCGIRFAGFVPFDAVTFHVIRTSTSFTPSAWTACLALAASWSRSGQAGVVSSIVKETRLSATWTSLTNPSDTMSRCRSGSWMALSAFKTS